MKTISDVLDAFSELNDFGFGVYEGHLKRKTPGRVETEMAKDRECLRNSEEQVDVTRDWIRANLRPIKTLSRRTSYGLKHIAERDVGYITNGVFITAMVLEGYGAKRIGNSPNCQFNASEKSIKKILSRQRGF